MDVTSLEQAITDAMNQIMPKDPEVGVRVAAITSMTDDEVRFLGYGEYKGRGHPPYVPEFTFEAAQAALPRDPQGNYPMGLETEELRREKFEEWKKGPVYASVHLHHRILLDDGETVWGSECHFTPADKFKDALKATPRRIQWVCFARKEDGSVSYEIEAGTA